MSSIGNVARRGTRCPRCDIPLAPVKAGEKLLAGCGKCRGVWVDRRAFDQICKRDSQARRFGAAREACGTRSRAAQSFKCPICYYWMEAKNFENCPELVVDVCRRHGTWMDANELQSLSRFLKERKGPALSASGATATVGAAVGGVTLAGVAASGALTTGSARQDRSTLERGVEWLDLFEFVDIGDIGDIGEVVLGVAEIGLSLFEGL